MGRKAAKRTIIAGLTALAKFRKSHTVIVESQGGFGKTALILDSLKVVELMRVEFMYSCSDRLERRTPYYPWRTILDRTMGLDGITNAAERSKVVQSFLSGDLSPMRVLLNSCLNTVFEGLCMLYVCMYVCMCVCCCSTVMLYYYICMYMCVSISFFFLSLLIYHLSFVDFVVVCVCVFFFLMCCNVL